MPTNPEQPDYKLAMLAAAEASFAQASLILHPIIRDIVDNDSNLLHQSDENRVIAGLELLEEAMEIHDKYMKAAK